MILPYESTEQKIEAAMAQVKGQPNRLTWHLHQCGPCYTGDISSALAIGNISAAAAAANVALRPHGLVIVATLPKKLLETRFGKSMSHIWSLKVLR